MILVHSCGEGWSLGICSAIAAWEKGDLQTPEGFTTVIKDVFKEHEAGHIEGSCSSSS